MARFDLRPDSRWVSSLFWLGVLAVLGGLIEHRFWSFFSLGSRQLLVLGLLAAGLAWLLCRVRRCRMATALGVVLVSSLFVLAGPLACLAALLLALAGLAVGSWLVPVGWEARAPLALLAGLAVLIGVNGWCLPFPVHYRLSSALVWLALILVRRRAVWRMLSGAPAAWSAAVAAAPRASALAMLTLFSVSVFAWLPTTGYDDLAYHLALPAQLADLGWYRMDAASNVWALAPWAADVLQGMAQVLAGHEARGAVNMLWFVASCLLLWRLGSRLALPPARRWLLLALLASLPLAGALLHSMQTEGPTLGVLLAMAWVIVSRPGDDRRALLLLGLLAGLMLGIKVSNLWFLGPLGLWYLCRHRGLPAWRALPWAICLAVLAGGSSYVYAASLAGNPVLPLFNGWFHSSFYASANFHDARWDAGFGWSLPWSLVFDAGRHVESLSLGPLVLIALAGSLLVALARREARPMALIGLLCLLLPLSQIQYARYAWPAFGLLLPAMVGGLPWPTARWHARAVRGVLWGLVACSALLAGSVDWQVKTGQIGDRLSALAMSTVARRQPMRDALAGVNARLGEAARVLILDRQSPFAAEMAGRAFVTNWYDPSLSALFERARQSGAAADWQTLLQASGANVLIWRKGQSLPGLPDVLRERRARPMAASGALLVWRLPPPEVALEEASKADRDELTLPLKEGVAGPVLLRAELRMACRAGDRVELDWQARMGAVSSPHVQLLACPVDGHAVAHVWVQLPRPASGLRVRWRAAGPLRPSGVWAGQTHDLRAARDLATRINAAVDIDLPGPGGISWSQP